MLCAERGCHGEDMPPSTPDFVWAPELRRCPKAVFTPEVDELVGWWCDWKTLGVLPFGGDLMSAPAYVTEVIRVCEYASLEYRAERHAEHEAEIRRRNAEAEEARRKAEGR